MIYLLSVQEARLPLADDSTAKRGDTHWNGYFPNVPVNVEKRCWILAFLPLTPILMKSKQTEAFAIAGEFCKTETNNKRDFEYQSWINKIFTVENLPVILESEYKSFFLQSPTNIKDLNINKYWVHKFSLNYFSLFHLWKYLWILFR